MRNNLFVYCRLGKILKMAIMQVLEKSVASGCVAVSEHSLGHCWVSV